MSEANEPMDSIRWERVQDLLAEVLELPLEAREPYLSLHCAGDAVLRAEVESLVDASEASDGYFDDLAGRAGITLSLLSGESGEAAEAPSELDERSEDEAELEAVGRQIGQYRVLEWLGKGGMANVFLAERDGEGFTQQVALKLVPKRISDPLIQRRSNEERRILARLEHRSIARLIDGGMTPEGHPFYAMEYVDGLDILSHCNRNRLRVKERLELFLEVLAPVHFAHQRLVVHCDLKPSNIFVTDDGHVKLLDFGVARLIDPDAAGDDATGLWFTPAYASPEQVRREPPGTHSDVYSLGVLLYEILTGHRPYRFVTREQSEVKRVVCEEVPAAPTDVVTRPVVVTRDGQTVQTPPEELAAARNSTPERMRKRLSGDLDALVMKALAKDPTDRYQSAEQLADDIRRHLAGQVLEAVPHTVKYRTRKFLRRNRGTVAAAIVVGLTLGAGIVGTLWQARRATDAAATAIDEAEKSDRVAQLMLGIFRLSDPSEALGDTVTAREVLDSGTERIRNELDDQPIVKAQLLAEISTVYGNLGLLDRAESLIREALQLHSAEFGENSLEASASLTQLGALQGEQGDLTGAIETLGRAIAIRESLVEFPDSVLMEAQAALAWRVRDAQDYDRAADLFVAVLEGQRAQGGEAGIAETTLGLAATFHDAGRFDEADSLFQVVINEWDPASGPSPLAVSALSNVGMIRRLRGQFDSAEPLLRLAVEMGLSLYGPDHIAVFSAQTELGAALNQMGRSGESEVLLRKAVGRATVALGPEHVGTARLQEALAGALRDLGQHDESFEMYKAALEEKIRRHAGADHPGIVSSMTSAAGALVDAGRLDEARVYLERGRVMNARLTSGNSVYTILSHQALANIARKEGALAEAEGQFDLAIAMADEMLSPDHRYTLSVLTDYAALLTETDRIAEAVALLERVLAARSAGLGAQHPTTLRVSAALDEARARH